MGYPYTDPTFLAPASLLPLALLYHYTVLISRKSTTFSLFLFFRWLAAVIS